MLANTQSFHTIGISKYNEFHCETISVFYIYISVITYGFVGNELNMRLLVKWCVKNAVILQKEIKKKKKKEKKSDA